ncbi:site-specific integrase, partial [Streptococcus suis]
ILNVYSHILDDDRRKNAELFEKAFYEKKELEPDIHQKMPENTMQVPEGVDPELLGKVLAVPEMTALLAAMASKMKGEAWLE